MEPGRKELAGAGWGKFSALGSIALRAQIRQQRGADWRGGDRKHHSTLRSPAPPVGARTRSRDEKVEIGHGKIMEVMLQVCQCFPFIRG